MSWKIRFEQMVDDCRDCPWLDESTDHIKLEFYWCLIEENGRVYNSLPTDWIECPLKVEE